MKYFIVIAVFCCALVPCYQFLKGDSIGCYIPDLSFKNTHTGGSADLCIWTCQEIYYKYAILSNGTDCLCGNAPGTVRADPSLCDMNCSRNSSQLCGGAKANSVYDTGINVPGPPSHIHVSNITDNSFHIQWNEPEAHGIITQYKVKYKVVKTYDPEYENKEVEYFYPNSTFSAQVESLQPGTKYNVTVCGLTEDVDRVGVEVHQLVETVIGVPEPSPLEAHILERRDDHMIISIPASTNVNGPITKYRIVVVDEEYQHGFNAEFLKDYEGAVKENLSYYIAAQLEPEDIRYNFVVGNKHIYDGYYNAPLPKDKHLHLQIAVGVVSIKNEVTKVRYTHSTDITILNVKAVEESSNMVVLLSVAIAIGVLLLIAGLAVIVVLRRRVGTIRRQRLSQSMPLSGPCIEIENTGFIPDEEQRVDHYGNLKRQLWNIPRNFLEVDTSFIVGMGNFGRFIRARVQHQGAYKPALVQVVADGELSKGDKKQMLGELDVLIKSTGHDNIVVLIGICEIPETLYVVLEDNRHTLKELLLSSRHADVQDNKFSLISEYDIVKITLGICKGMEYLASKKILHKRLCCRNIIMTDGNTPRVSGFGLSHIYPINEKPDYTRWTALEMFKQNNYHTKSDVWSFGCLLWEVFSLGGTPYPNVMSKDVPTRVMKGSRPPQLHYLGDDLYQICLHCWQLDLDERPTFTELVESLDTLLNQFTNMSLDFTLYNGFEYEIQHNELELFHLM